MRAATSEGTFNGPSISSEATMVIVAVSRIHTLGSTSNNQSPPSAAFHNVPAASSLARQLLDQPLLSH